MPELQVRLPRPHPRQLEFLASKRPRRIIRAGRRGGKTIGVAILAVESFLDGKRVLYTAPTQDQVDTFWRTVVRALQPAIDAGVFALNKTTHAIERPGTEQKIRAKTAWNADTLRGDYADLLIFDEWQLMAEDAWETVGAPMMADRNGTAVFIYTPPSLRSRSASKAIDPRHAARMYARAQQDDTGRWAAFSFPSQANPHISAEALDDLAQDMTSIAYRMEILAEDVDENPAALWTRKIIENARVLKAPELDRIAVGIDPSVTATGDEAGVLVAGRCGDEYYVIEDRSLQASPIEWARAAVIAYHAHMADRIIAESNNGGEMVAQTLRTVDPAVPIRLVTASRGKAPRAEPISALYEQGRVHHVGAFPALEDEMCHWTPGDPSPNRMDALVWVLTELRARSARKIIDRRRIGL